MTARCNIDATQHLVTASSASMSCCEKHLSSRRQPRLFPVICPSLHEFGPAVVTAILAGKHEKEARGNSPSARNFWPVTSRHTTPFMRMHQTALIIQTRYTDEQHNLCTMQKRRTQLYKKAKAKWTVRPWKQRQPQTYPSLGLPQFLIDRRSTPTK
ncbi:hypothetical protein BKA93DRAFT_456426 [Sparassis latifolia]